MKSLTRLIYANALVSALYALLSISFHADISLLAFPLALLAVALTSYLGILVLLKKGQVKALTAIRKCYEYEPLVMMLAFIIQRAGKSEMPYVLDLLCALLWLALTVISSIIVYRFLNAKKLSTLKEEWQGIAEVKQKKYKGLAYAGIQILEWLDAIVYCLFAVFILNIFLFQLYVIPSESMVPTFLVKDRVFVLKTAAGPHFPLSKVGLPCINRYKRGDVIVLRNPHYKSNHASEVQKILSDYISMITLNHVILDRDENGEQKADPLVKRITGQSGEQLVMLDGNLYARTKDSETFEKVYDEKAMWNLNSLSAAEKKKVQLFPLSQEDYDVVLELEEERRNLDLEMAADECKKLAETFKSYSNQESGDVSALESIYDSNALFEYNFFRNISDNAILLLKTPAGHQWFTLFMTDWISKASESSFAQTDMYADANFRLNVMVKLEAGKMIVRLATLIHNEVPTVAWSEDKEIQEGLLKIQKLNAYIGRLDQRNMPVFPKNKEDGSPDYIPANCFFMMGDNRYNSLDMRHSYDYKLIPLTSLDKYSVTYYSNMEPQYVSREKILGKASFRIWPFTRLGLVK